MTFTRRNRRTLFSSPDKKSNIPVVVKRKSKTKKMNEKKLATKKKKKKCCALPTTTTSSSTTTTLLATNDDRCSGVIVEVSDEGETWWEIEKVLKRRKKGGMVEYLVAWKGWSGAPTWIPRKDLCDSALAEALQFELKPTKSLSRKKKQTTVKKTNQVTKSKIKKPVRAMMVQENVSSSSTSACNHVNATGGDSDVTTYATSTKVATVTPSASFDSNDMILPVDDCQEQESFTSSDVKFDSSQAMTVSASTATSNSFPSPTTPRITAKNDAATAITVDTAAAAEVTTTPVSSPTTSSNAKTNDPSSLVPTSRKIWMSTPPGHTVKAVTTPHTV